jgi:hypothetical protein
MTHFGPLDILGTIGQSPGYDDLNLHKKDVAAERDLAVLPIVRRTLEEKRHR